MYIYIYIYAYYIYIYVHRERERYTQICARSGRDQRLRMLVSWPISWPVELRFVCIATKQDATGRASTATD